MKKTIVIVILAVLTLASFSMLSVSSVRADASEAKVLSYSWYVAPSNTVIAEYFGDLVAVGEIQNVGSNILGAVSVGGIAYNSTGTAVASNVATAYASDLLPGQKAPFYIDFPPEASITGDQSWVPSVTNVTVEIAYVTDTNATQYSGLTIPTSSTSYVDRSGTFTVTGSVQNTGDETPGNVWVDATFYNSVGTVVGLNYTNYLSSSLAPGASVTFTATPTDNTAQLSSEITNYSFLIQSSPPTASATSPPSGTSAPQPSSSPVASTQPTPSPLISSALIYAAVSAIVIVVVVLAPLLLLRKRHKNKQFEPPPPPPPPPPP